MAGRRERASAHPGLEAGSTLWTGPGEAKIHSYPDPRTFRGAVAVSLKNLKPPECSSKEVHRRSGVRRGRWHGHVGSVACGQVPAPPGPTSWPHRSWVPRAEKPQPHQKEPTPQLGKPKLTPGLVVGRHGDGKTQLLPSTLSPRARRPLVWLCGGSRGEAGTVPPRKPLLPRAARRGATLTGGCRP